MFFVADHGEHEDHRVVDALDTAVGAGMVGARGDSVGAEALVEGVGEFEAELKAVCEKKGNRASPERDVAVDEDVGHAGCGELSLSSGGHIGAAAEAGGEHKDVGVGTGCSR